MTKWILVLSIATLLTRNGLADILVQPGYKQAQHHSIITQPPETLGHLSKEHDQQQPKSADSGYHLEFHPVYTDSYHIPTNALYPILQHYQVLPQLTQPYYNHLNSGQVDGLGLAGMPVPSTVHSRYRRSIESNVGEQRTKRDTPDAVATKSSLDKDTSPVIDLQSLDGEAAENLDEKNVKVRQSDSNQQPIMANSLLGLNPSNMYPMYQEYRIMEPSLNSNQEITNAQMLPQTNAETAEIIPEQSQYSEVSATPIESPQINLENLQHPMLLQHPQVQQQQEETEDSESFEKRNFPDPRPSSTTHQSPEVDASNHDKSRKATIITNNFGLKKETINLSTANVLHGIHSTNLHEHKIGGLQKQLMISTNHHNHGILGTFRHASPGNHPFSHVAHKKLDGTSNNLARNNAQQVVQVYQSPNGQSTVCSPTTQYTVLPQTYASNYVGNYGYPSSSSSYRICVHNTDSVPYVSYQAL